MQTNNFLEIGIAHYLTLSSILFVIGIAGIFINKKSLINILMSIELILLAVNINFIAFSAYLSDLVGQIFSLFILTIAAAESAIGLAIIVVYWRVKRTIEVEDINELRG